MILNRCVAVQSHLAEHYIRGINYYSNYQWNYGKRREGKSYIQKHRKCFIRKRGHVLQLHKCKPGVQRYLCSCDFTVAWWLR